MNDYNVDYSYDKTLETSAFSKLMRNVYIWMTLALVITGFTALYVAKNEAIVYKIMETPAIMWGLIIAEFAVVFILASRLMKMSFLTAGILFGVYSILNGVTLSFVLLIYTAESVATTFFITAGTFAAMSVLGFVIKKDLGFMRRILMMALIGIIIATVVNIFVKSSGMGLIISYAGVLIFVGLTAYDTQKIKQMLQQVSEQGETNETSKIALYGSFSLYLDFINLFIYLLRILGDRR